MTIVKGREAVTNLDCRWFINLDVGGSTNNYILLNGSAAMDASSFICFL
jgi:hypothetical protein